MPIAIVLGLTLVIGLGLAVVNWNYEFIFYGAVLLLLVGLVWLLDRRVRVPTWVLWGMVVWTLAHLLGGTVSISQSVTEPGSPPNLYNLRLHPWLPKYDQVVHAFGFGISTVAAWRALSVSVRATGGRLLPRLGPLIAIVLVGMGIGAVNEALEFAATRIMPETNVGGYDNTGWDLVSNLVGCIAAAVYIRWNEARNGDADSGEPVSTGA